MANPRKCTESTPSLADYAATRFLQRTHGEGLNSWVYAYANRAPIQKAWVGCGIEIAVHLGGEWRHEDAAGAARELCKGEVVRVSMGETYRHASRGGGSEKGGLQVGFVLFGERLRALEDAAGGELRFRRDAGRADPELVDLASTRLEGIDDAAIADAVAAYVLRHCEPVASPLVRAKRELERWFDRDLPIPMIAEAGGTSATAFTRGFLATYGVTPAAYRVMLRANAASRMLWMKPDAWARDIAEACGFPNVSYFFRTFRRAFGLTPTEARARFLIA
jgi:AraC-like DNA-binding protein